MEVQFFRLEPVDGSLRVGPYQGSIHLEQDIALAFEDPELEERLEQLLDKEELIYRAKSEGGNTLYQRPAPGSEEWVEALLERLERSDFRLFGRFVPHS